MALPAIIQDLKTNAASTAECSECGWKSLIETSGGLTCSKCGLIIEERRPFVEQQASRGEGGCKSNAILNINTPTLIGTTRERFFSHTSKLGIIQARIITPAGVKRSRIYHLVTGVVHSLQIPDIIINHATREYDRVSKLIQRNTAMANSNILAAICIINVARKLGVIIYRDSLLEILGIQPRDFKRIMMQVMTYNKDILILSSNMPDIHRIVDRVVSTVNMCINATGENYARLAFSLYRILANYLIGMREDTKVAVISYLLLKKLWPNFASLSHLATCLHCRISSLYNALTRILERTGMRVHKKLSRLDLSRHIDSLMTRIAGKDKGNNLSRGKESIHDS